MALFDSVDRIDPSPRGEMEDSFSFLNRVDTPFWGKVRALLEQWFTHYPAQESHDLREAFRSNLPAQHYAAWWELYLHELFHRLGYAVDVHPTLPDSPKTPDFLLCRDGSRLYVEAAVLFSGIVTSERRTAPPWMLDAINHASSPNFFIRLVEVRQRGDHQLKRNEIVRPLEAWLAELDPGQVLDIQRHGGELPTEVVGCRGWEIAFEAWPKNEARGKAGPRVLGIGPIQAGGVNDIEQLRSTLKRKAGRYGEPSIPFVIAVQCLSAFMELLDIEQALFGSEAFEVPVDEISQARLYRQKNGFWISHRGPQNRRVSAVLTGVGLHPTNIGKVAPSLWMNPWAHHPLEDHWPFSQFTATEQGQIAQDERAPGMNEVFDLPLDWPGGKRFARE